MAGKYFIKNESHNENFLVDKVIHLIIIFLGYHRIRSVVITSPGFNITCSVNV